VRGRAAEPPRSVLDGEGGPVTGTTRMRILAGLISFDRFLFGVAFIAQPNLMDRSWIGKQARPPGAQVLARALGARDLALGLGGLQAVTHNDGSARPWLAALAICDAVAFRATLAAGRGIPRPGSHQRARDSRRVLAALGDRGSRDRPPRTRAPAALGRARPHRGPRSPDGAGRHGVTAAVSACGRSIRPRVAPAPSCALRTFRAREPLRRSNAPCRIA
jgi:hypothetical protein